MNIMHFLLGGLSKMHGFGQMMVKFLIMVRIFKTEIIIFIMIAVVIITILRRMIPRRRV